MADDVLKVTRHDNYAVLSLNRPEKRNALNQPLIEALNGALAQLESDKEVRALLLRGEGASFCISHRSRWRRSRRWCRSTRTARG